MTTRKPKATEPDTPAMTLDAPTAQRSTAEIDAEIATKEAELEALRRERAYVPFPRVLYREAAPPVTTRAPKFKTGDTPAPVDVDTVVVYSEDGVTAATAEGYTDDLESIVDPIDETDPTPPDPEAPIDQSTSRY